MGQGNLKGDTPSDTDVRVLVDAFPGDKIKKPPQGARGLTARPKPKLSGNQAAGRPLKPGERYPSGQLKPEIAPSALARLRTAVERGLADPKFGSQVGTLLLQRRLTPAEAATAFRIGEVYGRFEAQNGLRRSTRSPSYESGRLGSGGSLEQLSDEGARRIADIHTQWLALQGAIEDLYPDSVRAFFRMRGLLEALCVEDTTVPAIDLPDVIGALRKLGKFFNSARGRPKKRRKWSSAPIVNGSPTTTPARRQHQPRRFGMITSARRGSKCSGGCRRPSMSGNSRTPI